MNKTQKWMLTAVLAMAAVLMVCFTLQYLSESRNLSSLKEELAAVDAEWNRINDEKLILLDDLDIAQNSLRKSEKTLEDAEKAIEKRNKQIETLEKEIEELRSALSPEE